MDTVGWARALSSAQMLTHLSSTDVRLELGVALASWIVRRLEDGCPLDDDNAFLKSFHLKQHAICFFPPWPCQVLAHSSLHLIHIK